MAKIMEMYAEQCSIDIDRDGDIILEFYCDYDDEVLDSIDAWLAENGKLIPHDMYGIYDFGDFKVVISFESYND